MQVLYLEQAELTLQGSVRALAFMHLMHLSSSPGTPGEVQTT